MKLTSTRLKTIIKEELALVLESYNEYDLADDPLYDRGGPSGTGRYKTCPNCDGHGAVRHWNGDPQTEKMCPVCDGEGVVEVYE